MREYADVPPEAGGPGGKAGPGKRFLARLLDGLVLLVPALIVSIPFGGFQMGSTDNDDVGKAIMGGIVVTLLSYGYFVLMESNSGATVGKRALGYRIVGAGGGTPTPAEAAKRNAWMLLALIPGALGGLLTMLVFIALAISISSDPQGRGYHDRWAGATPELTK